MLVFLIFQIIYLVFMCTFTFSNNVLTNFSVLTDQNISSKLFTNFILVYVICALFNYKKLF